MIPMIPEVTKKGGVIDFHLPADIVKTIRGNTYLHCDFTKLGIVGQYTPVNYFGVEGV